tara:strand:+ start:831 stop:1079 length:249 start_codon:yes stop_codon:yes gene_type:complete
MPFEYHVAPIAFSYPSNMSVQEREKAVADHLGKAINHYAKQDWEFYRLETVQVVITAGCLAIFSPHRRIQTHHQMVFRRSIE